MRVQVSPTAPKFAGMAKGMTRLPQKQLPRVGAVGSSPTTGTKLESQPLRLTALFAKQMVPSGMRFEFAALLQLEWRYEQRLHDKETLGS